MFEVVILIPVLDNDKDLFPASVHEAFEAAALEFFGGFTRLPVEVVGAWLNDSGFPHRDATRVYIVAVGSLANGDRQVRRTIQSRGPHRRQLRAAGHQRNQGLGGESHLRAAGRACAGARPRL